MNNTMITIRNMVNSALEIRLKDRSLFIDAINSLSDYQNSNKEDIFLFTHADEDHFSLERMAQKKYYRIIGPSSVCYRMLTQSGVTSEKVCLLESADYTNPQKIQIDELEITCYSTKHFIGWEPLHCSYLLSYAGYHIYITGDSYMDNDLIGRLPKLDCIICNLVDEGFIKATEDRRFAYYHHMSYLLKLKAWYDPTWIAGVHLIGFDGTADATKMKEMVEESQIEGIWIPQGVNDKLTLMQ